MTEPKGIALTGGDPSTPRDAAERILLILGCTNESGGAFQDDVETISTIISDLVTPGERARALLQAFVAEEISTGRLLECIRLWSEDNDFVLPGEDAR